MKNAVASIEFEKKNQQTKHNITDSPYSLLLLLLQIRFWWCFRQRLPSPSQAACWLVWAAIRCPLADCHRSESEKSVLRSFCLSANTRIFAIIILLWCYGFRFESFAPFYRSFSWRSPFDPRKSTTRASADSKGDLIQSKLRRYSWHRMHRKSPERWNVYEKCSKNDWLLLYLPFQSETWLCAEVDSQHACRRGGSI